MADTKVLDKQDENLEDLFFKKRKSVDLTPYNASFFRSEGGLVSLKLKNEDGEEEFFERVLPI